MTVRELLTTLAPALNKHVYRSNCNYSRELVIEIKYGSWCNDHIAAGRFSGGSDLKEYTILKPFNDLLIKQSNDKILSVLDDIEIDDWDISSNKDRTEWKLLIRTEQLR